MDKILLHSCCAPCSVYCVDTLRGEGIEPVSLWFNPNIHPWTEYDQRRSTLLEYGEKERVEVHILEDYGLRDFVRAVAADIDHRCAHCSTNNRDSFSHVDDPLSPEFGQKSKSYFLVDFCKDFTWDFLDHCHCELISKRYSCVFKDLVNRDACKASIYKSLYLVAIGIIATHIC